MKYQGKVANPREMILWTRKKEKTAKFHLDREILHDVLKKTEDESIVIRVEDLVKVKLLLNSIFFR